MAADPLRRRLTAGVRIRITAVATVVVAIVLATSAVVAVAAQRRALTDDLDDRLRQRGDDIAALATAGSIPDPLGDEGDADDGLAQLVTAGGDVIASSENVEGEPPVARPPRDTRSVEVRTVDDLPIDEGEFRLLSRWILTADGLAALHVAADVDDVTEGVEALTVTLAFVLPVVLAAIALLIWVVVGRTLRPVDEAYRREQRFVADASHELRTPLTSIRSELEVDLAHPSEADLLATHRSVLEEAVALERLVDDLLYLARSDAGAVTAGHEAVDLDEIVLREAAALRGRARATVRTDGVSGAQVRGDEGQLARAVRNLLDNADRHARSSVTVTLTEDEGRAVLTVADDGPGIPPDQSRRVFERFARVDDARGRDDGGVGLGLAIVHDIVARHGGTVRVDDERPGAAFVVSLPTG
jgi:signal transduction histidine kinase